MPFTRKLLFAAVAGLSLLCGPAPAWAGFEWVPPSSAPAAVDNAQTALVPAVEQNPLAEGDLLPVPGEKPVVQVSKVTPPLLAAPKPPVAPAAPSAPIPLAVQRQPLGDPITWREKPSASPETPVGVKNGRDFLVIDPYPGSPKTPKTTASPSVAPAPLLAQAAPPPPQGFSLVEGFGSDMPLALALRQVVPPEFAYSLDTGINAASPVSWDGGKPWNEVVSGMIAPLGLQSVIRGKVVHIRIADIVGAPKKPDALQAPKRMTILDPGEDMPDQK